MNEQLALLPDVSITSRSLSLPDNCTREHWEECGTKIGICVDAGPFIIGDWINEGVKKHGISLAAFLKSDAAKSMPGIASFSYDSLNSFASVMEKLPRDYRVHGVSFGHHQAASKTIKSNCGPALLSEVRGWLQAAKDKKLSLREMTFAMQGRAKLADAKQQSGDEPTSVQLSVQLETSISDISIALHRRLLELASHFEKNDDPVSDWTNERKLAAKLALEPVMDDLTKLTDCYVALCQ